VTPRVVRTRTALREALGDDAPGLVPTMGALHAGHAALIRRAVAENERTVVSIFVNPTQFGDRADLAAYPRTFDADLAAVAAAGADLVFAPPVAEIYPLGFATTVEVGDLAERWEGAARPGHFRGVATVVTILLNLVRPGRAYFGEKDYQQLQIVKRLHADLALPGVIVGCPTVRDADGLALSSRNGRLSPADRLRAAALPRALMLMADLARDGVRDATRLEAAGRAALARTPELTIDYLAVVDGATLEPAPTVGPGSRALAAVQVGGVRLIDNVALPTGDAT
jgi:pantoate--beta-alanine ligase